MRFKDHKDLFQNNRALELSPDIVILKAGIDIENSKGKLRLKLFKC